MLRATSLLLVLFALTPLAHAQDPPATDIWLIDLPSPLAPFEPDTAVNATDRDGYDNQPFFLPDGSGLYFTSFRGGQTDIYRYDLTEGSATQVTDTPESEYSPTPYQDGARLSTIRVEADGTQRLWSFDASGSDAQLVLEDVAPVGYHAWGDAETLGLFVLGDPPTFQRASATSGESTVFAANIGRSIHRIPGEAAISFAQRSGDGWQLMRFDLASEAMTPLTPPYASAPPSPQHSAAMDYAWHPSGVVLAAFEDMLYQWDGDGWTVLTDLAEHGLSGVTRLAVSPDGRRLALVADR